MTIRTSRERLLQAAGYEFGGLIAVAPVCASLTGAGMGTSVTLVVVLIMATLLWPPLFNTLFDRVEWNMTGRVASDRSLRMRLVHAFALEASDTVISVPILMALGGLDLHEALLVDLALMGVYVAYGYVYHAIYDRLRPVARPLGRMSATRTAFTPA